jgi:hypothetical protein
MTVYVVVRTWLTAGATIEGVYTTADAAVQAVHVLEATDPGAAICFYTIKPCEVTE